MTMGLFRSAAEAAAPCQDKVFLITGAYGKLGVETVRALLGAGAGTIIIGGRNPTAQAEFLTALEKDGYKTIGSGDAESSTKNNDTTNADANPEQEQRGKQVVDGSHTIDLADLDSVQKFAQYVKKTYPSSSIDGLICNAGIMNSPASKTKQNFELQMGVNVIGHFLLCQILAPQTKRQVWVSSFAHTIGGGTARIDLDKIVVGDGDAAMSDYDGWNAYQQSKLGNVLLAKEFSKRYSDDTRTMETASLHPGVIYSGLYQTVGIVAACKLGMGMLLPVLKGNLLQIIPKAATAGAATTVTCATMPSANLVTGGYYSNCQLRSASEAAVIEEDAAALFDFCDKVTKDFQ